MTRFGGVGWGMVVGVFDDGWGWGFVVCKKLQLPMTDMGKK